MGQYLSVRYDTFFTLLGSVGIGCGRDWVCVPWGAFPFVVPRTWWLWFLRKKNFNSGPGNISEGESPWIPFLAWQPVGTECTLDGPITDQVKWLSLVLAEHLKGRFFEASCILRFFSHIFVWCASLMCCRNHVWKIPVQLVYLGPRISSGVVWSPS